MRRRHFLISAIAGAASPTLSAAQAFTSSYSVTRSDQQWRRRLTPFEYKVLREGRTERAFSSPLVAETRPGSYHCKGCQQMVYDSRHKFEAGTGWPSFFASLEGRVGTRRDLSMNMRRVALYCTRCGSHLGHLYADKSTETGQRHSLNGIALIFVPER